MGWTDTACRPFEHLAYNCAVSLITFFGRWLAGQAVAG
jgi:hypothetical protein